MTTTIETAQSLYRALREADVAALAGLLHPDFTGVVSAGMPANAGGVHRGPEAMLMMWGRVAQRFAIHPEPEEFLPVDAERVVVTGDYLGKARATGKPIKAAFAHVITARGGQLARLQQITDTQQWAAAAHPDGAAEIARSVMDAVAARDFEALQALYAEDIEIVEAESLPYGGVYRGHEGAARHAKGYLAAWDALQSPADRDPEARIIGDGGLVAALWRLKAARPGGARLNVPALSLFTIRLGRVSRLQMHHQDTAALLDFLGGGVR